MALFAAFLVALSMTPTLRRFIIELLRWVAALATLAAVVVLFRVPLLNLPVPSFERALTAAANATGADRLLPSGTTAPPGFQLRGDSDPPRGELWVDGQYTSTMPVLTNVLCSDGQEVELEVRLTGYQTWRRTVDCREGGQLEINARLEQSP